MRKLGHQLQLMVDASPSSRFLSRSDARFTPPPPDTADGRENERVWGFNDTEFKARPDKSVVLSGRRYELSGQTLPSLFTWMEDVIGVTLDPEATIEPVHQPVVEEGVTHPEFVRAVTDLLGHEAIIDDEAKRLRRGHGHTQREMWDVNYGRVGRFPDLVVEPSTTEQVEALVELGIQHGVVLSPYGGGTNVTEALRCDGSEKRFICSVDMRRMNRILWIDPVNRCARIQAGAVGRHITQQLAEYGWTIGHEPDSVEFSTLGGWVATNASGMKKNRYGNIEDIVLSLQMVTAKGTITRKNVGPRESVGVDPQALALGSEGTLGIVTDVTVQLFPVPEVQDYASYLFRSFDDGVRFLYNLTEACRPLPASVRLVDNLQFQFSLALKAETTGVLAKAVNGLQKRFVTKVKGFAPDKMVACTVVYEGSHDEVKSQRAKVEGLVNKFRGMSAGSANGQRGYQLTFGIAYIRDFVMKYRVIAESFETSVSWSDLDTMCARVKARVRQEHAARGLPGAPFVSCRVTQLYDSGAAVYFYLALYLPDGDNPAGVFAEIEEAARDEILKNGGSLSHHHGVGRIRSRFLPRIASEAAWNCVRDTKSSWDPTDVFGLKNQAHDNAPTERA